MEADLNVSLQSIVEDCSPPESPPTSSDVGFFIEESDDDDNENEELRFEQGITPYSFEPLPPANHESDRDEATDGRVHPREHLDVSEWCSCGFCMNMATGSEKLCCREVRQVMDKCSEAHPQPECMTQHPGFEAVCLNPWVLQVEYASMLQYYGEYDQEDFTEEERYRHTAYRTFVRWCWGYLGKCVRVVIPSCIVQKIRHTFPSEQYQGFQLPRLHAY